MTAITREQIGALLSEVGSAGSFAAQRTRATDDLHLEVKGVGRLRFPVSAAQAKRLCRVARPARYGQGEQTLLDRQVRDTWEIPKSRVKIDKRRWNRTLLPVLEALRADLGLSAGCRLKAELHAMLVYAPGKFFLPHKDSEKADAMVGTLVVTLPASFKGGAIIVEHRGESVTYRGSKERLSFVAFYADCQHEVRPVKEGYRVVLTYNVMLQAAGATAGDGAAETAPETVEALAGQLCEHFETPLPPPRWDQDAPPGEAPNRLVYLLDHQYTERGLRWHRLKGEDAARAAALRAAAEECDCELVLALAEVHEKWGCFEPGWDDHCYGRHRRWQRDEDDEWLAEDDPPVDDPNAYELGEIVDWDITLGHWIDPEGKKPTPIVTRVLGEEVCCVTPSSALEPYASEYEGYMGNYGNTMDRWYRRAAVVLWPRERAFGVRAEASPAWALAELKRRIRSGKLPEARQMAERVIAFWGDVAPHEKRRGFFEGVLRVAEGLDAPALAASLLRPFPVEALTPREAPAFAALVKCYGEQWTRSLLSEWSASSGRLGGRDSLVWLTTLPRLSEALRGTDRAANPLAARLVLQDRWRALQEAIEESLGLEPPSQRDHALAEFSPPIIGLLESAAIVGARDLRDEAVAFLCGDEHEALLPCLVLMLRTASTMPAPAMRVSPRLDAVRRWCIRRLKAQLAARVRGEGDWSITLPEGCRCKLCGKLEAFLSAADQERLEWPLAKAGRLHVHRRIDAHELPVRHQTRRSGSPFTLVLSKTKALFEREARQRKSLQSDLDWLAKQANAGKPRRSRRTKA